MTELLLSRSRRVGDQLRVLTNRVYLTRALELGFTEVGFVNAESPCVCRDATRTYLWMVLEPKDALPPNSAAQRIDSLSVSTNGVVHRIVSGGPSKAISTEVAAAASVTHVNRVAEHPPQRAVDITKPRKESAAPSDSPQSVDVIEQAIALRNQLRTVVQGLTELVAQIRQQRKHSRLMKSTLQSLKQLQLLDA